MTVARPELGAAVADAGPALFERAASYALGTVAAVRGWHLPLPTPCQEWDVRLLVAHMNDSLAALQEAISGGRVRPLRETGPCDPGAAAAAQTAPALVAAFRVRATWLLGSWSAPSERGVIAIGDLPLMAGIVAAAGAVEIAVHGWDVSRACGQHRPIPPALATDMLKISPLLVCDRDRHRLFAAPVTVPPMSCASDRLVAFLGRDPAAPAPRAHNR
jgi:uncharacterized protein (TIGR03086 family)